MRTSYPIMLAVLAAALLCIGPAAASYAAGPEESARNNWLTPQSATPPGRQAAPSSTLWRRHIWEALPPDLLKGPEPEALSRAYSQTDWRPFFIDSRFQPTEAASLLLARLNRLDREAIDPGPFKLPEIQRSIERLDSARIALKTVDPDFVDLRADALLSGESPQPISGPTSPAVVQHEAANPGKPSADPPAQAHAVLSPAAHQEAERAYEEAFRAAAGVDIQLASALARYAAEANPHCGDELQKALAGEIPMAELLKELEPDSARYEALLEAYARYRKLAEGPQQPYNGPLKVKHGEAGNHIRDLQKRLSQEDFYSGAVTGVYDTATQQAMKSFQAAHNLDPDGVIGQKTKDWLNVSFRDKAAMIAFSLKAMRQSSTRAYRRYIRINIPQFMLEYYKDGKLQTTHRVVVGQAAGKRVKYQGRMVGENNTPMLTSTIQEVIANPRWYVSDRIRLELNAQAGSDPEYFERHGYVQMASVHPWGQRRMFQKSGPRNALGRVKFEFPNVYAVYMHDTPLKHLFQRSRRDFSHGCIRLDKAVQFAETLLADDHNPQADRFASLLTTDRQTFIRLSEPVPIVVEYVPAGADASGQVVFFGDLYGLMKDTSAQKS